MPTFLDAILFQWMNPKAWIIVVAGVGVYVGREVLSLKMLFCVRDVRCRVPRQPHGLELQARFRASHPFPPGVFRAMNVVMGLLLASTSVTLF